MQSSEQDLQGSPGQQTSYLSPPIELPRANLHTETLVFTRGLYHLPQSNLQRHRKKCDPEHEKSTPSRNGRPVTRAQASEEGVEHDKGMSFRNTLL